MVKILIITNRWPCKTFIYTQYTYMCLIKYHERKIVKKTGFMSGAKLCGLVLSVVPSNIPLVPSNDET